MNITTKTKRNLLERGLEHSGQITIIPQPELRGFGGDSRAKPPFGVTSAEVLIICTAAYVIINSYMIVNFFFKYTIMPVWPLSCPPKRVDNEYIFAEHQALNFSGKL